MRTVSKCFSAQRSTEAAGHPEPHRNYKDPSTYGVISPHQADIINLCISHPKMWLTVKGTSLTTIPVLKHTTGKLLVFQKSSVVAYGHKENPPPINAEMKETNQCMSLTISF